MGFMTLGALLAACGDSDDSGSSSAPSSVAEPGSSAAPATSPAETTAAAESSAAVETTATAETTAVAETTAAAGGGGTLRFAVGDAQAKDSLDPAVTLTSIMVIGGGMIYDTLLDVDSAWELSPMLAEDYDVSADSKVWTFKLRQGVEFHDGSPLTSADVAWQYARLLDEATGSPGFAILSPVLDASGVEAPDPTTIRFTLKQPDAFFGVKAAHYTTRIPKKDTSNWIDASFGTGPFKSVSFQPGEGFEYERNPNYWQQGRPLLDGIVAVNIPEQSTRAEAVLNGDVDVADPPAISAFEQFEKSDTAALFPTSNSPYLFDVDSSIKPFSDPRVSQAMKMLIDREAMLNLVVRGRGQVSADSLIPPGNPFYPQDLEPYPFDPERAKALLAEAGYGDGFKEKIWTTTAYPYLNEGAAYGKEAWSQGGIDIEIASVSNDRYLQAFLNEPIVMDYGLAQHPVTMFELYYASDSPSNLSRYKDPEIDDWLSQLKSTTDPSLQAELSGSIIKRYAERAAEVCPFHFDDFMAHKQHVQGLVAHPMMKLDFRGVSIA